MCVGGETKCVIHKLYVSDYISYILYIFLFEKLSWLNRVTVKWQKNTDTTCQNAEVHTVSLWFLCFFFLEVIPQCSTMRLL